MHKLFFLQETPSSPEIAVVKLTDKEHKDLHDQLEKFVNKVPVFPKPVNSVKLNPHPHAIDAQRTTKHHTDVERDRWFSVLYHYPSCMVVGTCVPIEESDSR